MNFSFLNLISMNQFLLVSYFFSFWLLTLICFSVSTLIHTHTHSQTVFHKVDLEFYMPPFVLFQLPPENYETWPVLNQFREEGG